MKKTLTVLAILATFASATPASARDCGCNTGRGRNPLISADVNVGGHGGLVDIDANVGGSRGRGGLVDVDANVLSNGHNSYGNRGGSLVDVDANIGGRNGLLNLDANVGGRRNGLIDLDVGILGGGVGH
jgi:hypothetical protein